MVLKLFFHPQLGRPEGERNAKFSLAPVAARLTELLGQDVKLLDDCIGADVEAAVSALEEGRLISA